MLEYTIMTAQTTTDLTRFLNPRGVAIVVASSDLTRIDGQPIRLLTEYGYQGKVYPVNPKYAEIKGLTAIPISRPCPSRATSRSSRYRRCTYRA